MMSIEEFEYIWKDTEKEQIIKQYYYDYYYMRQLSDIVFKIERYVKARQVEFINSGETKNNISSWHYKKLIKDLSF